MFSEFLIVNEKGGIDFNLVRRILNILGSTKGLRRRFCFTWNVLHIWLGCLSLSYYFIIDRDQIISILVNFWRFIRTRRADYHNDRAFH